jgi:HlyD family secretion protein
VKTDAVAKQFLAEPSRRDAAPRPAADGPLRRGRSIDGDQMSPGVALLSCTRAQASVDQTSERFMAKTPSSEPDIEKVLRAGAASGGVFGRHSLLVWSGLAVAAAAIVAWFWLASARQSQVRYFTEAALRGDLTVTVTATGTVEPTNTVDVSSELSGIVRDVLVDDNDHVSKDQDLAKLDTDKLEAQVLRARATLEAAKAKLLEAEATVAEEQQDLERQERLATRGVASQHDLAAARAAHDRALAARASAAADIDVAEANLKLEETNLEKACICAPIDGIVLQRNVEPGQTVASSFQAPVLFVIAEDLTKMELEVDVDEADVGAVREGQQATFTVDAYPDRSFPAKISQLHYAPETVEGVVTYKAVLSVDNSELLLRPGMTATAEIKVKEVKDALLVPNAALRFSPPTEDETASTGLLQSLLPRRPSFRKASKHERADTNRTVWVLRDGVPAEVPVRIGATDGARTEIVKGDIEAGAAVIVDARQTKS